MLGYLYILGAWTSGHYRDSTALCACATELTYWHTLLWYTASMIIHMSYTYMQATVVRE